MWTSSTTGVPFDASSLLHLPSQLNQFAQLQPYALYNGQGNKLVSVLVDPAVFGELFPCTFFG